MPITNQVSPSTCLHSPTDAKMVKLKISTDLNKLRKLNRTLYTDNQEYNEIHELSSMIEMFGSMMCP